MEFKQDCWKSTTKHDSKEGSFDGGVKVFRRKGTYMMGERWGAERVHFRNMSPVRRAWYKCVLTGCILGWAAEMCAVPGQTWYSFCWFSSDCFPVVTIIFKSLPIAKPTSFRAGTGLILEGELRSLETQFLSLYLISSEFIPTLPFFPSDLFSAFRAFPHIFGLFISHLIRDCTLSVVLSSLILSTKSPSLYKWAQV